MLEENSKTTLTNPNMSPEMKKDKNEGKKGIHHNYATLIPRPENIICDLREAGTWCTGCY